MNEYNGPDDERLRHLLDDAVSDVEPRDSLDSIRARTGSTPFRARRPWLLGAGAAVLATAATVAAVAVMGNNPGTTGARQGPNFADGSPTAARSAEPSAAPEPSPTTSPPSSAPSGSTTADGGSARTFTVPVYYVSETGHGPRLFREFRRTTTGAAPARVALQLALGGDATDPDYTSFWPEGTVLNAFRAAEPGGDESIRIDLGGQGLRNRPAGVTPEQASASVEQLVYTAQALTQSRAPVQFLVDGKHTDTLLGVPASEPLAEGEAAEVLAQVWVIEPAEGAEVHVPFEVSGLANAWEANVQWELMRGDRVVADGYTMADEAFTMAPYSFRVKNVPPGDYTLVVHDEDASGGAEGSGVWKDTKNITVVE